jgi:exodeoxyribonuclease VII small subunit
LLRVNCESRCGPLGGVNKHMAREKTEQPKDAAEVLFAQGMERLEAIVTRLESGDLALEEALEAFEAGVGLVRVLNEKLSAAEQRVEILSRGDNGALHLVRMEREEP